MVQTGCQRGVERRRRSSLGSQCGKPQSPPPRSQTNPRQNQVQNGSVGRSVLRIDVLLSSHIHDNSIQNGADSAPFTTMRNACACGCVTTTGKCGRIRTKFVGVLVTKNSRAFAGGSAVTRVYTSPSTITWIASTGR